MNITNKQKAIVVSALATVAIGAQGIMLHNKTEELNSTKFDLSEAVKTVDSYDKDLKEKNKYIDGLEAKFKKASEDINEKDKKIKSLESENARLKEQSSDCPTQVAKSSGKGTPVTMTLSFYGDGDEENGGYGGITAYGEPLRAGIVASNVHSRGTKFEYNGQVYTVGDRGGASHFDNPNRLDVFVPRRSGESKDEYDRRISNYGKQTVTMYKY